MGKGGLKILAALLCLLVTAFVFISCGKKSETTTLKKVRLNEVTRSVFYAPMYSAMALGYFKEEGLEIDLTTGEGADTTVTNTQVIE